MRIGYYAPPGFDYSSNQITEGIWLAMQRTGHINQFLCTGKVVHHGAKVADLPLTSEEELNDNLNSVDMILMSTGGDMTFAKKILPRILSEKKHAKKFVFIDGHDSNAYLLDPAYIALYLKRELRYPEANCLQWSNVRGFLFGVYDFHFDAVQPMYDERDIDVSFVAFGGSSKMRSECVDILAKETKLNIFAKAPNDCQPLEIDEYRSVMRRSKVIISIPGAGIDTLRFWEAMGFGAILCSVDIQNQLYIRNCPEPLRHAMYFRSWEQMLEMCRQVVSNRKQWQAMRSATDTFIRCNHSTTARALQMISLFKELA